MSLKEVQVLLLFVGSGFGSVAIVAPGLEKLVLASDGDEFTVSNCLAPNLEDFLLNYTSRNPCVGFGDMWQMRDVKVQREWRGSSGGTRACFHILSLGIVARNVRLLYCLLNFLLDSFL